MKALLVLGTLLLSGCSVGSPGGGPTLSGTASAAPPPTFIETAVSELARAVAEGADESQLELLRRVQDGYVLTFDDINTATEATFTCFEENSIGYTRMSPDESAGFPIPQYSYDSQVPGLTADQTYSIAQGCITGFSDYVAFLYIMQPATQDVADAYWARTARPVIMQCLAANGVSLPADATRSEIEQAVMVLWLGEDLMPPSEGPDCEAATN
jgi:hypothetical protein